MLIEKPIPFILEFVEQLNNSLSKLDANRTLTRIQKSWISFCIYGILITNTVCWAKFERFSFGQMTVACISWMFRKSKIAWDLLLQASVNQIIQQYHLQEGILLIDDTDKRRSKSTTRIAWSHKILDKSSGGFIQGQCIVFLVLVTDQITVPVGFFFHMPDPQQKSWQKQINVLKKKGVSKVNRPRKPKINANFPSKFEIALRLLQSFKTQQPNFKVRCILADAYYGHDQFISQVEQIYQVQIISELRLNQKVSYRNKIRSLESFFKMQCPIHQKVSIRGKSPENVCMGSARLHVCSHGKKRHVIALKYENESAYRYLEASDLSWRAVDIVQAYSIRWLIEVFFEDWKSYEGWGQLTKQPDEEGSSRGLILSLLLDHCLLLHPEQKARIENKLPAATVGSLKERIKMECTLNMIKSILLADDRESRLKTMFDKLDEIFPLKNSSKHLNGNNLDHLHQTKALRHFHLVSAQ